MTRSVFFSVSIREKFLLRKPKKEFKGSAFEVELKSSRFRVGMGRFSFYFKGTLNLNFDSPQMHGHKTCLYYSSLNTLGENFSSNITRDN